MGTTVGRDWTWRGSPRGLGRSGARSRGPFEIAGGAEKCMTQGKCAETSVGKMKLVYLDNAATSQKPRQVLDTLNEYYEEHNANIHRGVHRLAEEATALYEGSRERVARFLGAPDVRGLIFTRGTTESINLVAHAWGRKNLREGDEILLTEAEHHSNLVPWQLAARATGAKLRFIPVREDGTLDMEVASCLISPRTKMVG